MIFLSGTEIDVKRGERVHTLTPTPRRRSDPEFLKWDSEINAMLDDDYEGELNFNQKKGTLLLFQNIVEYNRIQTTTVDFHMADDKKKSFEN